MMLYLPPALILALLIAGIHAAVFHLAWGRTVVELLRLLAASILGFSVGELAARSMGYHLFLLGDIHLVVASIGSWAGMALARWWRT